MTKSYETKFFYYPISNNYLIIIMFFSTFKINHAQAQYAVIPNNILDSYIYA